MIKENRLIYIVNNPETAARIESTPNTNQESLKPENSKKIAGNQTKEILQKGGALIKGAQIPLEVLYAADGQMLQYVHSKLKEMGKGEGKDRIREISEGVQIPLEVLYAADDSQIVQYVHSKLKKIEEELRN